MSDYKADPFYLSAKWKRLRAAVLRRDGYMCQLSKRYGKRVQATHVHHIFPRESFPEYQLCAWNLISVCAEWHNKLHDRTTDALTAEGLRLMERVARDRNIQLK